MSPTTILAIVAKLIPILTALPGELPAIAKSAVALINAAEAFPVLGALIPASVVKLLDEVKTALSLFQSNPIEALRELPAAAKALAQLDLSDLPAPVKAA